MFKKILIVFILILFTIIFSINVSAQEVLMNSAETINPGNFKLAIFPTMLIGRNGGDSIWGFAGRAGLGLTRSIDIEAKGATFKNFNYFGVDIEYWFFRGRNINASVLVGGHMTESKIGADTMGMDTALILSTKPARKLELYGGLKMSFDSIKNTNQSFTLAHIVPGFEYRISSEIDFLAEFGISLNNDSKNYFSFGFAYYLLK